MFKIYSHYKGIAQERESLFEREDIIRYHESVNSMYEIIGLFRLKHIDITIMDNISFEDEAYPYLIILNWRKTIKEFYYFDTILGVIEMLSQFIPIEEEV